MPDHLSRTGSERLRRRERLRSSKDFRRVNRTGRRSSGRHFVIVSAKGREPGLTRLGLAVSRRVGNAVQRNRVKRRVRSWFRRERGNVPEGLDLVVIARRGAADRSGSEVAAELRGLVE
ncbi:MAG: ribonuclease P protein component [Deltaproteobacteria bacterium]|jgi:ribonuclease P protein component|nr:ribonuclease P protein component [Deltaproteobacteria bacterium]